MCFSSDMKKQLKKKDEAMAALENAKEEALSHLKDKEAELKAQLKKASGKKQGVGALL